MTVRQHAQARSSPTTKCRKTIVFRDELPKSNVGKILRKDLRDGGDRSASTPADG